MYIIKKIEVDCFKKGENHLSENLKFKKPGFELPVEYSKHVGVLNKKIKSWRGSSYTEYDHFVVRYKSPYEGSYSVLLKVKSSSKKSSEKGNK